MYVCKTIVWNKTQNHKIYIKEQIACKLKKQHHVPSPTMQKINNHICIWILHWINRKGLWVKTRVVEIFEISKNRWFQFFKYFRIRRWLVLVVWKILESKNRWSPLPSSRTLKKPAVFMKELVVMSPVIWFFWELWLYTRTGSLIFTNLWLWRLRTALTAARGLFLFVIISQC